MHKRRGAGRHRFRWQSLLIVGDHKPMNDQLAEYAGKTITVKGKMAERGGVAMLENAEIDKNS